MIFRDQIGAPEPPPAEGVGFEPTVPLPVHQLSGLANSATLAPLRLRAEPEMLLRIRPKQAGEEVRLPREHDADRKAGTSCWGPQAVVRMRRIRRLRALSVAN